MAAAGAGFTLGTWLAIAGTAAAVTGAAVSAYAQYEQGVAQQQAARYNARVLQNQALVASYSAQVQRQQQENRLRRLQATQRTVSGASGVTTEGSPLAVMMDTATQGAYEQALTTYAGEGRSAGYTSGAGLAEFQGRQAATAGAVGAGGSLLTGAGSGVAAYQRGLYYSRRGGAE
jgi:argininosuccinate synthase